ncbi:DUF6446 family protein [Amaricoccus sp.]|uniref:DUF6446 family protein n=1 Tax=Amaricoccus sp. TaxID=1872485 RepID=UPI00261023E9|nr:DUF6446 family protein [uncultured Amaricoccus sp.]
MNGRRLVVGFLIFLGLFAAALIYTQFFAFYERQHGVGALRINGEVVPIADFDGIDATSSPLKLRGCFRVDPAAVAGLTPAAKPTPLNPPFWFRCFDAGAIEADLASGAARAYAIGQDQPEGFDIMIAVYPDGRGYLWRQLGPKFVD